MGERKRVLGRVRLSKDSDSSTSIERQQEAISAWATAHGHDIVGWAIDVDVSGSVSPFDAPQLGPWLNGHRHEWDILAAWKLDRLGRTLFALNDLFQWCNREDKTLTCIEDSIDLSTWTGRLVAAVIAGVAEGELEAIRTRTRSSHAKLRERGQWHGGTVPYGYRAVKREDGWFLELDSAKAEIAREVVDRVIDRQSLSSIARDLTARKVSTPGKSKSGAWSVVGLNGMLRSRTLVGQVTYKGKPVIDQETGLPQQRAEPVIDYQTWQAVQSRLDDRKRSSATSHGTGLLAGVAFCLECEAPLYHYVNKARGQRHWRCSARVRWGAGKCSAGAVIPAEDLEDSVEEQLMSHIGGIERQEWVYEGSGNADALEQVQEAIETVREEKDLGLYEGDRQGYLDRLAALIKRRKALESQQASSPGWRLHGLGETYAQAWKRMDTAERRNLMRDAGIKVHAKARPWQTRLYVPADLLAKAVPGYRYLPPSGDQR